MSDADPTSPRDRFARPLVNLRISVTDRCNLRCGYCMPEEDYVRLPKDRLLSFEEIDHVVGAFERLGLSRIRLTGGEPLLRRDLHRLVALLAARPALRDIAMTTNGLLLAEQAQGLHAAGLGRLTLSLDTLRPERFRELTRSAELPRALAGLDAAVRAGFTETKINAVILRGVNDDEVCELLEFARAGGHELRYIEYMDVGGATRWSAAEVVPRAEILARLTERYGAVRAVATSTSAPAERYALPDGTLFGIVASTTAPFCGTCDRARLTADGRLYTCLYARDGLDLAGPLRAGASEVELAALVAERWRARTDRGAEERLGLASRTPLADSAELARDPHLEMHTRGG